MKKHLIITTALNSKEFELSEDDMAVRLVEYQSCFYHALKFKNDFDTITILECISKESIKEFEEFKEYGISVYYSKLDNEFKKGQNEVLHMWDFIKQDYIDDEDIIIKLTGRYILYNTNILSYFNDTNIEFVGKNDFEMYHNENSNIHGFLYGIKKKKFKEYYSSINTLDTNQSSETALKNYAILNKDKSIILDEKIGVITCLLKTLPFSGNCLKLYL